MILSDNKTTWQRLKGCKIAPYVYQPSVLKDNWIAGPVTPNRRYGSPDTVIHATLTAKQTEPKMTGYAYKNLSSAEKHRCYRHSAQGRSRILSKKLHQIKKRKGIRRISI